MNYFYVMDINEELYSMMDEVPCEYEVGTGNE